MPKYTVIITRDVTESTVVEVDAENQEAAGEAAMAALDNAESSEWEIDDGSWNHGNHYVTDVSPRVMRGV